MLDKKAVRELWLKRAKEQQADVAERVAHDIETYRKGYTKLRFVDEDGKPVAGKKVKITQQGHDFKHGANIFMLDEFQDEKDNQTYREDFKKYFNLATVPFYWQCIEPEEGKLRFDKNSPKIYRRPAPDLCLEYCDENGIDAKLHCLVYEGHLPDWLPKTDMKKMEELYDKRMREISERYSGRLYEYEVVNELLIEHYLKKQSVISEKRDIMEWAFGMARKHFPNEILVFNEAQSLSNLGILDYRAPVFMMLESAIRGGAEIDKIGIQHHIFTGVSAKTHEEYEHDVLHENMNMLDPKNILKGLDILAEFGLPLELTEVTIPTFGETLEDEELQADLLELLYTLWFSHPAVETIVYWNVPDGYAWDRADAVWYENQCRGGLLHHDLTPKKSAERLYDLFNKKWHTDLELVTDKDGYIDFRGFYGDYIAEVDDSVADFGIHKFEDNTLEIIL